MSTDVGKPTPVGVLLRRLLVSENAFLNGIDAC